MITILEIQNSLNIYTSYYKNFSKNLLPYGVLKLWGPLKFMQ